MLHWNCGGRKEVGRVSEWLFFLAVVLAGWFYLKFMTYPGVFE